MVLTLHKISVRTVQLGPSTVIEDGTLTVDSEELASRLRSQDPRIESVNIHVAQPGESVRILCTKDVLQPRIKLDGAAVGEGETLVLDGMAVVTCGPIVGFQEGIIDMSGPGADYTPFSRIGLLIIELSVRPGTGAHEHEATIRAAGLAAAEYLASQCQTSVADTTEKLLWSEVVADSSLPRIAYVDMLLSQGLLHDSYVLGVNACEELPRCVDPRLVIDGGVVSGNCVSACDKSTTYHHQNNPLIRQLLAGHGRRWNFVGTILTNLPTRLADKERSAARSVELVRGLAASGVVISKEGFGNPDADLMMLIKGLLQAGIASVAITDEFAGADGGSQSLADAVPEADALVSVGNANQRVLLPAMQRVIGPLPDVTRIAGGYAHTLRDDGTMELELQAIVGATNQLGDGRLSCREI